MEVSDEISLPLSIELLGPLRVLPYVPSLNAVVNSPVKVKYSAYLKNARLVKARSIKDISEYDKILASIEFNKLSISNKNIIIADDELLENITKTLVLLKMFPELRNLRSIIYLYLVLNRYKRIDEVNAKSLISSIIGGLQVLNLNPIAKVKLLPHYNPYIIISILSQELSHERRCVRSENLAVIDKLVNVAYLMFEEGIINYTYLKKNLGLIIKDLNSFNDCRELIFYVLSKLIKHNAESLELNIVNELSDVIDHINSLAYGTRISFTINSTPCLIALTLNEDYAKKILRILNKYGLRSSWISGILVHYWTNDFFSI